MDTLYKLQIHQLRAHSKGKLFSCHHCSFKSPRKKDVQGTDADSFIGRLHFLTKLSLSQFAELHIEY